VDAEAPLVTGTGEPMDPSTPLSIWQRFLDANPNAAVRAPA
jgi:hypothetical protein